jgi:hypothetical protein
MCNTAGLRSWDRLREFFVRERRDPPALAVLGLRQLRAIRCAINMDASAEKRKSRAIHT